jgi:DNA adenine methylase
MPLKTTKQIPKKRLAPPLKYHGGKHYLAARIVELMPRHMHYVEPFFGGGSVLLARDPNDRRFWVSADGGHRGVSEVVNDLNGRLVNLWRVLRGEDTFPRFLRQVEAMPLSRAEWEAARDTEPDPDPVADAVAFFVLCRQSLAGRREGFTSITRTRTRRAMNGNASEWLGAVEGLAAVHDRLRRVVIENMQAVDLIRREDTPTTLFYCDPPYLHEARAGGREYGAFEMTKADHRKLLSVLLQCKGKVMLSGYPSALYDTVLSDWTRHVFELPNNAAGGRNKRRMTEVLWCNFDPGSERVVKAGASGAPRYRKR